MKRFPKKYYPILCLILMIIISGLEEFLTSDGIFHAFILSNKHILLRTVIKGSYLIIFFVLGYWGLKHLSIPWLKKLWVYWFLLIAIMGAIPKLYFFIFKQEMSENSHHFYITFYDAAFTPFPFLFLLFISFLIQKLTTNAAPPA